MHQLVSIEMVAPQIHCGDAVPRGGRINSKLKVLGEFLLKRESSAVIQLRGNRTQTASIQGHPQLISINGTNVGDIWAFMLGFYDDNATFVLSNQDEKHPALATVGMVGSEAGDDGSTAAVSLHEVDSSTGQARPVVDDSPFMPGLQLSLLAGDARLFLFN